ncbi:MAG: hypothetical protein EPN30_01815 [Actinomycetota bacterium]|nr:MAG: hypothetical protein EPN30_01815 [Actinomycetota bacterium]
MDDNEYSEKSITLEEALSAIAELVENAKSMPLSASVLVPRDEILFLVDAALEALPVEIRNAQLVIRERHEIGDKARFEAEEIIAAATAKAERLVARTEITRQANQNANRMIQEAKEEAARLKYAALDYVDQKLASFEIALENIEKSVKAGRAKLIPAVNESFDPNDPLGESEADDMELDKSPFFDQDIE